MTALVVLAFALSSCKKVDDLDMLADTGYNPDIALPILNSSGTINDILDDLEGGDQLQAGADSLLVLIYEQCVAIMCRDIIWY